MKKKLLLVSIVLISLIAVFSMERKEEIKDFTNVENVGT